MTVTAQEGMTLRGVAELGRALAYLPSTRPTRTPSTNGWILAPMERTRSAFYGGRATCSSA